MNGMLIRNDEPKAETTFSLHIDCVHANATQMITSSQANASGIENEGEQLAKLVVNEDATKSKE